MTEKIDVLLTARNQTSAAANAAKSDFRSVRDAADDAGKGAGNAFRGVGDAISNSLSPVNSFISAIGNIGNAFSGLQSVVQMITAVGEAMSELAQRGAVFAQIKDVFGDMAASVGSSSDAMLSAMKKASQGTIDEFQLVLTANKAIQFEVAKTPEQLAKLVELSSSLGRAQGISDTDALGFLTAGIAKESELILDNLGILLDVKKATDEYAASLGKAAGDLTTAERKQALLNESFRQGEVAIRANRDAVDSPATKIEQAKAARTDLADSTGEFIAFASSGTIGALAQSVTELTEVTFKGGLSFESLNKQLDQFRDTKESIAKGGRIPDEIMAISFQMGISPEEGIDAAIADARAKILQKIEAENKLQLTTPDDFFGGLSTTPLAELSGNIPLQKALEGAPEILKEVANGLVDLGNTPISLSKQVAAIQSGFGDIEKIAESIRSTITNNAIKASDLLGGEGAFDLANRQIEEFDSKLRDLLSQQLEGELDPGEFLFKLQSLPSEATEIFGQVSQAARDGGQALREELSQKINLKEAFEVSGNDVGVAVLEGQIQSLQKTMSLVAPATGVAASGLTALGSAALTTDAQLAGIVTNAGSAGSAATNLGTNTQSAAGAVNILNGALAVVPASLANAAAAMIAAGADASFVAGQVLGLAGAFNQLDAAKAGLRRSIISRAAGVADIVGEKKALELANQEIASMEANVTALGQSTLEGSTGLTEMEFQTALLGTTTTSTFDEIEEADRKSKQLATQGLSQAASAANDASQAFDSLKGKVAGVLGESLNLDVGVDLDGILGREDAVNEDARRLADVAVKGFDSPWASYLSEKFPDLIGTALQGGDPKKAAAQLLRDFEDGLRPELLDKEAAKERVRRALIGDANMAALAEEIATELNAELGGKINIGQIKATASATLGVEGAEAGQVSATLDTVTSGLQAKLGGLGTGLKSGIIAALDGIGAAVASSIDKQFRAEGNLKLVEGAGYSNGVAWGKGFLTSMDLLSAKTLEKLAGLVTPYVTENQQRDATLQGAN